MSNIGFNIMHTDVELGYDLRSSKGINISANGVDCIHYCPESFRVFRNRENFRRKKKIDKINENRRTILCLIPPCPYFRTFDII
jgi:hypothetical protein